jgi:hypothetical protein
MQIKLIYITKDGPGSQYETQAQRSKKRDMEDDGAEDQNFRPEVRQIGLPQRFKPKKRKITPPLICERTVDSVTFRVDREQEAFWPLA